MFLQVHPQGWNVLSRNVTTDEQSEWTCVHDIQDIIQTVDLTVPEEPASEEANRLETSLADDPMQVYLNENLFIVLNYLKICFVIFFRESRHHRRTHVVIPRELTNQNTAPFSVFSPRGTRQADLWEAMMNVSGGTRIRSLRYLSGT